MSQTAPVDKITAADYQMFRDAVDQIQAKIGGVLSQATEEKALESLLDVWAKAKMHHQNRPKRFELQQGFENEVPAGLLQIAQENIALKNQKVDEAHERVLVEMFMNLGIRQDCATEIVQQAILKMK